MERATDFAEKTVVVEDSKAGAVLTVEAFEDDTVGVGFSI
jgi:hypothetical protein